MSDYIVRLVKFPGGKVHESVAQNEDGTYTIFLDVNSTKEWQEQSFLHALQHLSRHDFEKNEVQIIEAETHKQI